MEQVFNNPFRVIGVYATASERELQKQKSMIGAYLNAGKELSFDVDFPFLPPLERSAESIEKAFSQIQLNQNKLLHGLFWFSIGSYLDDPAFNSLKEGNIEKAIEIWNRITETTSLMQKNYLSYNNLSTIEIIMACGSNINFDLLTKALQKKIMLIQSNCFNDLATFLVDKNCIVEQSVIVPLFFEEMFESCLKLHAQNKISLLTAYSILIDILNAVEYEIRQSLKQKITSSLTSTIKKEIQKTKNKRLNNAQEARQFGKELANNINGYWRLMNNNFSDEYMFDIIGEKLASEILQCAIDCLNYYIEDENKLPTVDDEIELGESVLELIKDAKKYTKSVSIIQRIRENMNAVADWIAEANNRVATQIIEYEVAALTERIKQLDNEIKGYKQHSQPSRTITNSVSAIESCWIDCKLNLKLIEEKLGDTHKYVQEINSGVIYNIMVYLVEQLNSQQKSYVNHLELQSLQLKVLVFLKDTNNYKIDEELSKQIDTNLSVLAENLTNMMHQSTAYARQYIGSMSQYKKEPLISAKSRRIAALIFFYFGIYSHTYCISMFLHDILLGVQMKKLFIFSIILFMFFATLSGVLQSEEDSLKADLLETIDGIQTRISHLEKSINQLKQETVQAQQNLTELKKEVQEQDGLLESTISTLDKTVKQDIMRVDNEFISFNYKLGKRSAITLASILALFIVLLILWYVYEKSIRKTSKSIEQKIQKVQADFQEDSIKLDAKLIELFERQFEAATIAQPTSANAEVDHSLALKVADEVIRIQMNLNSMDANIKGHRQLSRAVNAIIDNFNANGYEIPELLYKEYDPGMKLLATMVQDEALAPGMQVIKRIVKPQVNYKGKMIQAAEVVVAFND